MLAFFSIYIVYPCNYTLTLTQIYLRSPRHSFTPTNKRLIKSAIGKRQAQLDLGYSSLFEQTHLDQVILG